MDRNQLSMFKRLSRWVRKKLDRPKLGVTHFVEMECPNTGEVFATEETEPIHEENVVRGGNVVMTYECSECGELHSFLWGPPAPLETEVPEDAKKKYSGQ